MSQATPAGAEKDSREMSQQQDSAAERVSGWSVVVLGRWLLWVMFLCAVWQ